jgi:NAD(P)-dependent dehydrogenase (short-subunit alcohol dehydrogenase family)
MTTFPFAPDALQDRVCLITGGGTGIGRAIALGMARCGARLVLASRKVENCAQVAAECQALGAQADALPLDIRDPASVEACFAEVSRRHSGRLDVLVNNAGANFTAPALGISPNGWRVITQTLIDGTFFCSQAAARLMLERGQGRIINNAGTNGWNGSPLMAHSGVGKAGILSMTETLAVEWGPLGITVNAVAPGAVSTSGANARLWSADETMNRIARRIPLGHRFGTPDDCVGAFLFLASDAAAFITGATVAIDGGQRLRNTLDLGND